MASIRSLLFALLVQHVVAIESYSNCSKQFRRNSSKSATALVASTPSSISSSRPVNTASRLGSCSGSTASFSSVPGLLIVAGCPPITLTTYTYSQVQIVSINTNIVTSYAPLPSDTTVTTTLSLDLTKVTYPNVYSQLVGTVTATVISVVPAEVTVTQSTAPGFTPVRCNAIYYNPTTTTNYSTSTDTEPSTSLIFTSDPAAFFVYTSTVTEYTSTATSTRTDTFGIPYLETVTETSTRDDPTSTVYNACATNNIVADLPGDVYIEFVEAVLNTTDNQYNSVGVDIAALDAADCCAQCQANSSCVGSGFILGSQYAPCRLFIKSALRPQTCDPLYLGAEDKYFVGVPQVYISNSGCGQFSL